VERKDGAALCVIGFDCRRERETGIGLRECDNHHWQVGLELSGLVSAHFSRFTSCRDGIARIAHARKTAKDLANNYLDAFVGLVGQYNRALPHHDVSLAIFMEGYKEAAARTCEQL
jgi:hypothetical protein